MPAPPEPASTPAPQTSPDRADAAADTLLRHDGLGLDITALRRQLHELRLLGEIIANMAEGVVLCRASDGCIAYANPRYETMLGYAPGELDGLPGSVVNSPAEAHPEAVAQAIMGELRRSGQWYGEVRNRRKDGRDIWCRVSISSFDHVDLGPVWVNVAVDVTEEHLARQASAQATAELNRLAARMQQAIEDERAALSRDVHDQLGAALTGMHMRLSALAARHGHDAALRAELLGIAATAQAASVQTREICSRLRPPALDDLGLVETCRWYLREWAEGAGITVRRHLRQLPVEPAPDLAIDVFRALQELLTNVARHAGATRVHVGLRQRAGQLLLCVADNGRGFAPPPDAHGLGLVGLRERVQRHGGSLAVQSGPGGTEVALRFGTAIGPGIGTAIGP